MRASGSGVRMPATTSSPCALTRNSPNDARLARRRVARERDARRRAVALVAEDHLDDVDRRAEIVGDVVRAPVDLRARRVPRVEDRLDRAAELLARVLRERAAGLVLVDPLERVDQLGEVVGGQVDVLLDAARALQRRELLLEAVAVDPVDRLAVHLDQPPVGVVGEAAVAGRRAPGPRPPRRRGRR